MDHGGQNITITGSGFLEMATNNIYDDGLTHSWTTTTVDYIQGGYGDQAIAVTSNGDVHIVYWNHDTHELKHAIYDGSGWTKSVIVSYSGGSSDIREVEMVVDGADNLHVAHYVTGEYLHYRHYNGTNWTIPTPPATWTGGAWTSPLIPTTLLALCTTNPATSVAA